MSEQNNGGDFWESWGGGMAEPVPAGKYVCTMREASVELSSSQEQPARTKCVFVIQDGPFADRYLWLDWPHINNFGWLAKMMWQAVGGHGRPNGDHPEHVFMEIGRRVTDARGQSFTVVTDLRSYKDASTGEMRKKSRVKNVAAIAPVAAPTGEAPQW